MGLGLFTFLLNSFGIFRADFWVKDFKDTGYPAECYDCNAGNDHCSSCEINKKFKL